MLFCAHCAMLVLLVMAVVASWAFGGISPSAQFGMHIAAAIAVVWALVTYCRTNDRPAALPWAVLPLIGGLLLGVGQMIQLPVETSTALSPTATTWRSELITQESASNTNDGAITSSVSLYPASTRNQLSLFLLGTICFVIAALVQSKTSPALMMNVVAVTGGVLGFFGLAQKLAWDGKLFWMVDVPEGAGPFASFVNKNNAAGFLLICLAAAIGSAIWATHRHESVRAYDGEPRRRQRMSGGLGDVLLAQLAQLDTVSLVAFGSVAVILTAVLASMSRGGWIALVGASVVTLTVALLSRSRAMVLLALGPAVAVGIAALSLIGLSDSFEKRVNTLFDEQVISEARIPHWNDGVQVVSDFWRTGSGLGTYRYVYPPYQRRLDNAWYYHAENQYLETAVEAGVPGLVLLGLMIIAVGSASWFLVRRASTPAGYALGFAGIFALSSQVIHAVADFALFIPSVTVLFAVMCGSVCGEAAAVAEETKRRFISMTSSRGVAVACLSALLVLSVFGMAETGCKTKAEAAMTKARPETEMIPVSAEVEESIGRLQEGLKWRPDDAELHSQLAEAYIEQGRLAMLDTLVGLVKEDLKVTELPEETVQDIWSRTKPTVVHGRAWDLLLSGHRQEFEELRAEAPLQTSFRAAVDHLQLSRDSCPLLPLTHLRLAEIGFVRDSSDWDQQDVTRAQRLAPADSSIQFRCGLLDLNAGRIEEAARSWKQALTFNRTFFPQIMMTEEARLPLKPDKFVAEVLPDDPMYLIELGQRYRRRGRKGAELAKAVGQRAIELADSDNSLPDWDRAFIRGFGARLTGNDRMAADALAEAVKLRPEDFQTRFILAELLTSEGRFDEALSHVRQMNMKESGNSQYETLMARIHKERARKTFDTP
ncbi:MAG: O-antigen ligase family protein [Planctomycetaceae bacterium]|nr:O-antigen ligase family protein [Planctomycetaceae bacterium]